MNDIARTCSSVIGPMRKKIKIIVWNVKKVTPNRKKKPIAHTVDFEIAKLKGYR